MNHALALARRGLGQVWPNPAVGCVVVKNGRVVGRGNTQPGGRPHAEVMALTMAGEAAKGATVYVTLEPCAHHGKTPPCAEALIKAGVARVVSALEDPDPRVAGKGHQMLSAAGVAVEVGLCADAAAAMNAGFLSRVTAGRPQVTLKLATSFDGRIATANGDSQWISGPQSRRFVHLLRANHDAVLVGGGTARVDDPMLTVRGLGDGVRQPVRIVASARLDLPLMGQLAQTAKDVPLWILHAKDADRELQNAWTGLGAELIACPAISGQLDPVQMMTALGDRGLTRILCEGGGSFAASLLSASLIDQIVGFTAGLSLGAEGIPAMGALGLERLMQAERFRLVETRPSGEDVFHRWLRS